MTRKFIKDGNAIIEDDSIRVRVTALPDNSLKAESMGPRAESMMEHSERIDEMTKEAHGMLIKSQPKLPMIFETDFTKIPLGLFLCRTMHERTGKHALHVGLKINDRDWHHQANVPFYSEESSSTTCSEFWEWAKKTLPAYDYPEVIKSSL